MDRLRLVFAGHNSHEALEVGSHTTIRVHNAKYFGIQDGGQAIVVDDETGLYGFAVVVETYTGLFIDSIRTLEHELDGERSHLRDGRVLATFLQECYPDLNERTPLIAINFKTYLRNVT